MTLKEYFGNDRFARLAGAKLLTVRPGYAKAAMPVTPDVLNASGIVQGGAIFTLADLAFAAAVNTHDNLTVSVNCNIAFLKCVGSGTLTAEAQELFDHRRLPFAQVRVTDQNNELIALFTSSGYRKSSSKILFDALE